MNPIQLPRPKSSKQIFPQPIALLSILVLLAMGLGACASAAPTQEAYYAEMPAAAPMEPMAQESIGGREFVEYDSASQSSTQAIERIVIKNANLSIVVVDPPSSLDMISKMAEEMGGFVVNANLYTSRTESGAEVPRGSVTIRVPAERLDEALDRIEAESDREPLNKTINSQDVTSDYTDLQSRLRNLENAEAQLTEIMGSATKTEDVLSVYNRLVEVREQIEVIKGQIQYYEQSAALSAISVELIANEAVQPLTIGSWQPGETAKDAIQGLIDIGKFLVNALIWIVIVFIPVLIILYLVFFLPLRFIFRKIRRPRQPKTLQTPSEPTPPTSA